MALSVVSSLRRVVLCALLGQAAWAGAEPADYVFVPYPVAGQWRVGYAFGTEKAVGEAGRERGHALSIGWTPTTRWFTQLYAGWYGEPGEGEQPEAVSWLNHVQIAGDDGPWSLGLYVDIERPREHDQGTGLVWGPTWQWDLPTAQLNVNLLIDQHLHAASAAPASLNYQWQVQRLWRPGLNWGAQGFGSPGAVRHWRPASQQAHELGPALFWQHAVGDDRTFKLDGALLFGLTRLSPGNTLRVRAQYEF